MKSHLCLLENASHSCFSLLQISCRKKKAIPKFKILQEVVQRREPSSLCWCHPACLFRWRDLWFEELAGLAASLGRAEDSAECRDGDKRGMGPRSPSFQLPPAMDGGQTGAGSMADPRPAVGGWPGTGLAASGCAFPSISVPESWGLEGLAQNRHGSLAISLTWPWPCPVAGAPREVVALWQLEGEGSQLPAKACAQQVRLQNESV